MIDLVLAERFWSKVDKAGDCWEWTGSTSGNGYGYFFFRGKMRGAHRISLILHGVAVPLGLQVDHICRNRKCVNPSHLRVVTSRENTLAENSASVTALNAAKICCPRGHPLTPCNLVPAHAKKGWRDCKVCHVAQGAAIRALKTGASPTGS